jgi:hypothetical protein
VARAPDLLDVLSILHRAVQVRAGRRKRPDIAGGCFDQDARLRAKLKNLPAIGFQLSDLPGYYIRLRRLGNLRRHKEPDDWVYD